MAEQVDVQCPCCGTKLVVDAQTGDVLSEERPKFSKDFDEAMSEVQSGTERREKAFSDAFDRTQRLDDVLQKKFEEAQKKAAKDKSEKPFNPLDYD